MRMMQAIEDARQRDMEAEEARQRQFAERAAQGPANLARLIDGLGELAEDFNIAPTPVGLFSGAEWLMEPRHWRIRWGIEVRFEPTWPGRYIFSFAHHQATTDLSDSDLDGLAGLLVTAEKAYQEELAERIDCYVEDLAVSSRRYNRGQADAARLRLTELAPERDAEWAALYAAWETAAAQAAAEQAAAQAERDAVLEMYRQTMEAWADVCEAIGAANRAAVEKTQDRVDHLLFVRDIEYGVAGGDDDGRPAAETRIVTAYATHGPAKNTWRVLAGGRGQSWTFHTITRVGEERAVRPSDDPFNDTLFLRRMTPWGLVAFSELHETFVKEALAQLRPLPGQPMIPDGLTWTDVAEIANIARDRAGMLADDPF